MPWNALRQRRSPHPWNMDRRTLSIKAADIGRIGALGWAANTTGSPWKPRFSAAKPAGREKNGLAARSGKIRRGDFCNVSVTPEGSAPNDDLSRQFQKVESFSCLVNHVGPGGGSSK